MRTGYWHGEDAIILEGNRKDGYTILVGGGYTKEEISLAKKIAKEDRIPEENSELYDSLKDSILWVDTESWEEQQI